VLVKELQSLALDVRVLDKDGEEIELTSLADEEMDDRNYVQAEDIGENVATDELDDSFTEEEFDDEDDFDDDDFDDDDVFDDGLDDDDEYYDDDEDM